MTDSSAPASEALWSQGRLNRAAAVRVGDLASRITLTLVTLPELSDSYYMRLGNTVPAGKDGLLSRAIAEVVADDLSQSWAAGEEKSQPSLEEQAAHYYSLVQSKMAEITAGSARGAS